MIWRSGICFSAVIAFWASLLPSQDGGAFVNGQVRLVNSKDTAVKKRNDFSGVVVWLTSDGLSSQPLARKHAQILQKDKQFSPHILAIQTGTSVDFPNLDPIFHNAFSNFDGQIFDIGLYAPGSSKSFRFTKPGVVRVFCNIHPSMSATIVVVDSSYFTVTDEAGTYSFSNVPAGTYQVHLFHERATPETLDNLVRSVVVSKDRTTLASTTISEAGYLAAAHKNKYGRDYPPDADGTDAYSVPIR